MFLWLRRKKLDAIHTLVARIYNRQEILMDDVQAILDQLAAANASLDGIRVDIDALVAQLAAAGSAPTPEQMASILTAATALATRASGIDAER